MLLSSLISSWYPLWLWSQSTALRLQKYAPELKNSRQNKPLAVKVRIWFSSEWPGGVHFFQMNCLKRMVNYILSGSPLVARIHFTYGMAGAQPCFKIPYPDLCFYFLGLDSVQIMTPQKFVKNMPKCYWCASWWDQSQIDSDNSI